MKLYFGAALMLIVVACSQQESKTTEKKDSIVSVNDTSKNIKLSFDSQKVEQIYSDYLQLKDALVNTKYNEAKLAANALSSSLEKYAGCENTAITAANINKATDVASQRASFTALNIDLIALFKHASLKSGTIYVQHCPMANKGEGGDWLSSEKKIQNPYYGSEMMECGAVIAEIKTK